MYYQGSHGDYAALRHTALDGIVCRHDFQNSLVAQHTPEVRSGNYAERSIIGI